jgi:hypothetical protein
VAVSAAAALVAAVPVEAGKFTTRCLPSDNISTKEFKNYKGLIQEGIFIPYFEN